MVFQCPPCLDNDQEEGGVSTTNINDSDSVEADRGGFPRPPIFEVQLDAAGNPIFKRGLVLHLSFLLLHYCCLWLIMEVGLETNEAMVTLPAVADWIGCKYVSGGEICNYY